VAALAGVPRIVIRQAERHLHELEAQSRTAAGPQLGLFEPTPEPTPPADDALRDALAEIDCDELTPRQALETLYRLQRLAVDD
jgi:DNA mismatch repair protein MutS